MKIIKFIDSDLFLNGLLQSFLVYTKGIRSITILLDTIFITLIYTIHTSHTWVWVVTSRTPRVADAADAGHEDGPGRAYSIL